MPEYIPKNVSRYIVKKIWPWVRKVILPMLLDWLKDAVADILVWLGQKIRDTLTKDAAAQSSHAEEQVNHAESEAARAPNEQVADAWRQAAEYWRRQFEGVNDRLQGNLAEVSEAVSTAHDDLTSAMKNAEPDLEFEGDSLKVTVAGESRFLAPPQ
jgi:hypothetical protein